MRRLPIYFCIDVSGSMNKNSHLVGQLLEKIIKRLRMNPYTLELAYISVWTFGQTIEEQLPLMNISDVSLPKWYFDKQDSGIVMLGSALMRIYQATERDLCVMTDDEKGDWKPRLFILTDNRPSDLLVYHEVIPLIQSKFLDIVVGLITNDSDLDLTKIEALTYNINKIIDIDDVSNNIGIQLFDSHIEAEISDILYL